MISTQLEKQIDSDRQNASYRNYCLVRQQVMAWLDEQSENGQLPSKYWQEELAGFDYLFDASPLVINKLRQHCYHITGVHSYEYRQHHAHKMQPFANKLAALKALDAKGLFVPEAPALGGFGHNIDGQLVNIDTLKFYESMIALERSSFREELEREPTRRKVVLEIGAGWGGFAQVLKRLVPNITYLIVDLPKTILFSGTYLSSMFPEAKCAFHLDSEGQQLAEKISEYDFVFIPHYAFSDFDFGQIDLAINMVSFQEMTTEQVTGYVTHLKELGCPRIYSHNRDRSAHNQELSSVSEILGTYYDVSEEKVLPVPYTVLNLPPKELPKRNRPKGLRSYLKQWAKGKMETGIATPKPRSTDYRHLFCRHNP